MARIRTIKPEFPQSESMGRVSRDARLLFVELWTICDDEGRTRGNSRMLASLLFPYDDDAPALIDCWIAELEREGCVVRYVADGSTYMQVLNWLNHQKIDKPSRSKIPAFDESSRILANPRERSCVDQGPRTKDQGSGTIGCAAPSPAADASLQADLLPAVADAPSAPASSSRPAAEQLTDLQLACRDTWAAYCAAYFARYGVSPVRTAKSNSQVKQIVQALGAAESPQVAAWFLSHPGGFYVQKGHDIGLLLADVVKLRTEWATGHIITATTAKQSDRRGAMASAVSNLLAECGGVQ